jgi:hypothetical protein
MIPFPCLALLLGASSLTVIAAERVIELRANPTQQDVYEARTNDLVHILDLNMGNSASHLSVTTTRMGSTQQGNPAIGSYFLGPCTVRLVHNLPARFGDGQPLSLALLTVNQVNQPFATPENVAVLPSGVDGKVVFETSSTLLGWLEVASIPVRRQDRNRFVRARVEIGPNTLSSPQASASSTNATDVSRPLEPDADSPR